MKFGVCTGIENAAIVGKAGFDFIECTVVSLQAEESDAVVRDTMERFLESPVPVEAFNILLPYELKITGESVDYDRLHRYLDKALERVYKIGGKTIVFGSGGSRRLPEGFSRKRGEEQILRFLHLIADYADPLGLTIVIEPLNRDESNIINSVPEASHYVRQVNRPSIRALADFYHMYKENEPLENIVSCRNDIRHVHVSDSRYAPGMGDYPYPQLVDCLARANYDGRVSIECLWNDFPAEAANGLVYLKEIFGQSGQSSFQGGRSHDSRA